MRAPSLNFRPSPIPTLDEIRQRRDAIRDGWTDRQRTDRRSGRVPHWALPEIDVFDLDVDPGITRDQ